MNNQKCFFHVDLDAFFASVEQILHPEYRGKPVIIAGDPHKKRNVVSTASYEARKYGVHSAMPSFKAYELCPHGIFIDPNMDNYIEYSEKVMNILRDFSPDVNQLSIDEACLDMTGTTRLFGQPIEAAQKIKTRVKAETGLTLSVGIATNSYLAKIASEVKKPDGLYIINPGDEESFMETLPLKDVWGIGQKTLGRLQSLGFRSVKDIKSHSLQFLKSLFGEASSSFLYNVSRGIEPDNFRSKPQTHSLSTETTFEIDLTDINTIETALLNLSEQLMRRLLKYNTTSKTVQLKIRYEDFSTVNIQETFETPVLCTDDFYTRIISLFNKKYEFGRGIRLLGVGVHNSVNINKINQPELFENKNVKKQKVEKAILQLENKHPEIKITKARIMNTVRILILFFTATFIFLPDSFADPQNSSIRPDSSITVSDKAATITDEANSIPVQDSEKTTIFSSGFGFANDKSFELLADGYWNLKLSETVSTTFGYENDFTASFSTPVFEQEVDLSLWFLLNNSFYVQGAFADKFNKNTFTMGYFSDNLIKEIKLSNRNIVFPEDYSLTEISRSIGGGDNQSPGISASLSKNNWKLDAAIRYDMLSSFDKTYYGRNAVSKIKLPLHNYLTGSIFIIPGTNVIEQISAVYVESPDGTFTDESNRKYKKIPSNEYLLLPARNQIILSSHCNGQKKNGVLPRILIEFDFPADSSIIPIGTFTNPDSYLGKLQTYFSSNYKDIKVWNYSYSNKQNDLSIPDFSDGTKTDGYFVKMNNQKMLLVQNSAGFSPFAAAYRYDGGASRIDDVQIASYSTETKNKVYDAVIADTFNTVQNDYFSLQHTFVDVYNSDYSLQNPEINYTSPQINYPFANVNPGIYLGFESSNDDCVMLKSISQNSRIEIGTKAVPGTVTVYKNGVIDSTAKYNPQTGEISLPSGVSDTDKLYITWYEETSDYQTGMLAAALGLKYDFTENLTGDIAASTRWSINPDHNYAEYKKTDSGYAAFSTGIKYNTENFQVSNISGVTYCADNISGKYRISGFDNAIPSTSYLIQDAARDLPEGFSPLLNPRPFNYVSTPELSQDFNCSLGKQTGITDKDISGYSIPVSYDFSKCSDPSGSNVLWASNAIITSANRYILSNTSKFELAVKLPYEFIELTKEDDVKIYLQLGVSADSDFKVENKGNIPTWQIFDSDENAEFTDVESRLSASSTAWQTVSVVLNDVDRSFISENYNARIIITKNRKSETIYNWGSIYIGPYQAVTQGIFASSNKDFSISTEELRQNNPSVAVFNKDKNYAQYINWQTQTATLSQPPVITVQKYFDEVDISPYQSINLYFSYNVFDKSDSYSETPSDYPLTIVLDRNAVNSNSTGQTAVKLQVDSTELNQIINFSQQNDSMHKLKIDRINRKVYVDNKELKNCKLQVNQNIIPTRIKIDISPVALSSQTNSVYVFTKGSFALDELFLSDASDKILAQNITKVKLHKQGSVLTIKDFSLISDPSLFAAGEFAGHFYTSDNFDNNFNFSGNIDSQITVASIKMNAACGRDSDSITPVSSASHSIETTKPLFSILTFEENFTDNLNEKNVSKSNSASLNFNSLKIPLTLKAGTKVSSDSWSTNQEVSDSLTLSLGTDFKYNLNILAKASQKISSQNVSDTFIETGDYFQCWYDTTKFQYSPGSSNASNRLTGITVNNSFGFPFANFSPQINFSEYGTYTNGNQTLFRDITGFSTVFPFKIQNQNFSFSYSKNSSLIQDELTGGDYYRDISTICKNTQKRDWYFTALPFYDLFSSQLSEKVLQTIPDAKKNSDVEYGRTPQSVNYNCQYDFTWKRPIFANRKDLFIPTIATLSVSRDISTAENIADTYQIKATTGYTAINVFSQSGYYPILKWCQSDEYNLSFQAAVKIPRTEPENIKQNYNLYAQANFYKTDSDVLRTGFQFTMQDVNNWNIKASVLYNRESKFTPVLEVVKLFNSKFDYSHIRLVRIDSLDVNISSSLAETTNAKIRNYQSVELKHQLEIYWIKQFAITTNIDAYFAHTKDEIINLNFTAGLGGKFNF